MRRIQQTHESGLSTEALPSRAKTLATVGLAGFVYFAVSLVALHFLRADYDPVTQNVSQYAVGPYGYLMTAAFFILGPAVIALAIGLFEGVTPPPRLGCLALGTAGLCVVLVGFLRVDPKPGAMPMSETIHNSAFMASFFFTLVAMLALTARFKVDSSWRLRHRISLVLSVAAVLGLLLFIALFDTDWRGLVQRGCIVTTLSWLLLLSARLWSIASAESEREASSAPASKPDHGASSPSMIRSSSLSGSGEGS